MELPEEENTPEKRVDRIFAMMDKVRLGWSWASGREVGRGLRPADGEPRPLTSPINASDHLWTTGPAGSIPVQHPEL